MNKLVRDQQSNRSSVYMPMPKNNRINGVRIPVYRFKSKRKYTASNNRVKTKKKKSILNKLKKSLKRQKNKKSKKKQKKKFTNKLKNWIKSKKKSKKANNNKDKIRKEITKIENKLKYYLQLQARYNTNTVEWKKLQDIQLRLWKQYDRLYNLL